MFVGISKSFSEDNTMRLAAATLTRALPITLLNLILTLSSQSCSIPLHSNAKFLLPTKESRLFSKKIVEFANLNRGETVGQTYNPDQIQQFNMVSKDQKHYFFIEIFLPITILGQLYLLSLFLPSLIFMFLYHHAQACQPAISPSIQIHI